MYELNWPTAALVVGGVERQVLAGYLAAQSFVTRTPLRLHLGCGSVLLDGWVNIDMGGAPYLVLDLRLGPPFPDASVDRIHSEHMFEHFRLADAQLLMTEAHRVLKPGGVFRTGMPDLATILARLVPGVARSAMDSGPGLPVGGHSRGVHQCDVSRLGAPVPVRRERALPSTRPLWLRAGTEGPVGPVVVPGPARPRDQTGNRAHRRGGEMRPGRADRRFAGGPVVISITRPALPPLSEYVALLERIWSSRMLSNFCGVRHCPGGAGDRRLGRQICSLRLQRRRSLDPRSSCAGRPPKSRAPVPSYTFNSTVNAILWNDLTPVFVDIDPETLNMDPADAAERVTGAGAILATHVFRQSGSGR